MFIFIELALKHRSHIRVVLYCFHRLSLTSRPFGVFLLVSPKAGLGKPSRAQDSAFRQIFTEACAKIMEAGFGGLVLTEKGARGEVRELIGGQRKKNLDSHKSAAVISGCEQANVAPRCIGAVLPYTRAPEPEGRRPSLPFAVLPSRKRIISNAGVWAVLRFSPDYTRSICAVRTADLKNGGPRYDGPCYARFCHNVSARIRATGELHWRP